MCVTLPLLHAPHSLSPSEPGAVALQVTLAVMICGWAHILHGLYQPWGAGSQTYYVQHFALFTTTFIFVMGLLFKVSGGCVRHSALPRCQFCCPPVHGIACDSPQSGLTLSSVVSVAHQLPPPSPCLFAPWMWCR